MTLGDVPTRITWTAAIVATLAFFACMAPTEPADGQVSQDLHCAPNEGVFNGACWQACSSSAECPINLRCMSVDANTALCLDYGNCAYLGDDTQCVGLLTFYSFPDRFGAEYLEHNESYPVGDPSDVTPYVDTHFVEDSADPYQGPSITDGCAGSARWQIIAPTTAKGCGQPHRVTRCRASQAGFCELKPGTTVDQPAP